MKQQFQLTKIKTQTKSLHSKYEVKVLNIIHSAGNWKICEILVRNKFIFKTTKHSHETAK